MLTGCHRLTVESPSLPHPAGEIQLLEAPSKRRDTSQTDGLQSVLSYRAGSVSALPWCKAAGDEALCVECKIMTANAMTAWLQGQN